MKNIKNIPLLVGITLPILFIIFISIIIFVPNLFIKPQYNFLYSNNDFYYTYDQQYLNSYSVEGGHLVATRLRASPDPYVVYKGENPPLFLYDVKNDSTHQITFAETQNLNIDAGPSSPDGYVVDYQYRNSGIFDLFGSNNGQSGYVISKGGASKKLHILNSDSYTYYNSGKVKFIGWIK